MSTNENTAPRLVIPALSGLYVGLVPLGYPLMRFAAGAILVPHGYLKLFAGGVNGLATALGGLGLHPAMAWAYWVALVEFVGGILLALGLFTRPVAVIIAIEMAVAAFAVHLPNGFFWTSKGLEYPLMWGLLCLGIAFRGGDRLSLDHAIGREI